MFIAFLILLVIVGILWQLERKKQRNRECERPPNTSPAPLSFSDSATGSSGIIREPEPAVVAQITPYAPEAQTPIGRNTESPTEVRRKPPFKPGVPQPVARPDDVSVASWSSAKQPTPPPQVQRDYEEVAFIDLETTGLDPEFDRVIETGIFILKLGYSGEVTGYSCLANPGVSIPRRITELTGITNEMVKDSKPTGEVIADFLDEIGDRTIAAYNAEFDVGFLRAEAARLGRTFDNDWVCVMKYVKQKHPDLPRYRLNDVCDAFGIFESEAAKSGESAHRALYDTERVLRLYLAVSSGTQPNPPAPSARDRTVIYPKLNEYHAIRGAAKKLAAQAKLDESNDLNQAIYGYRAAITLLKDSSKIKIYENHAQASTAPETSNLGDIDCLNRLTLCLCKLKLAQEAEAAVTDYFNSFPVDADLKAAHQIRKRIDKALSK